MFNLWPLGAPHPTEISLLQGNLLTWLLSQKRIWNATMRLPPSLLEVGDLANTELRRPWRPLTGSLICYRQTMALGDPADAATGLTEGWKRTHTWMTTRNLNVTRWKPVTSNIQCNNGLLGIPDSKDRRDTNHREDLHHRLTGIQLPLIHLGTLQMTINNSPVRSQLQNFPFGTLTANLVNFSKREGHKGSGFTWRDHSQTRDFGDQDPSQDK